MFRNISITFLLLKSVRKVKNAPFYIDNNMKILPPTDVSLLVMCGTMAEEVNLNVS